MFLAACIRDAVYASLLPLTVPGPATPLSVEEGDDASPFPSVAVAYPSGVIIDPEDANCTGSI